VSKECSSANRPARSCSCAPGRCCRYCFSHVSIATVCIQELGPLFNALRLRATTLTDLRLNGDAIWSMLTSVEDFTGLRELLALLEACHMLTHVQFNIEDEEGDANRDQIKVPEALGVRDAMVSLLESRGGTITFYNP